MPPCNCGGRAKGAQIVYRLHLPGKDPQTFPTKVDAEIARTKAGGQGTIIRTTQPAR